MVVDMRSVSIAELRQNPNPAFDAVEHGETVIVTRYRKEIGRIVPPQRRRPVTAAEAMAVYDKAPLSDNSWAEEVARDRADLDAEWRDPWEQR